MPDESRIEKQLKEMNATINGSGEVIGTEEPQSRIEKLLEEINGNLGKSSGGGVKPDWSVNDENTDGYIAYKPAIKSGTAYLSTVENAASSAGASRSHAEGSETVTRGKNSHAEGRKTLAEGENSHAEGCLSVSHGESSHAEGYSVHKRSSEEDHDGPRSSLQEVTEYEKLAPKNKNRLVMRSMA